MERVNAADGSPGGGSEPVASNLWVNVIVMTVLTLTSWFLISSPVLTTCLLWVGPIALRRSSREETPRFYDPRACLKIPMTLCTAWGSSPCLLHSFVSLSLHSPDDRVNELKYAEEKPGSPTKLPEIRTAKTTKFWISPVKKSSVPTTVISSLTGTVPGTKRLTNKTHLVIMIEDISWPSMQ